MKSLLLVLIRLYQLTLSALLGRHCRFEPSCSHYASSAIHTHGAARGSLLAALRVCRCGPSLRCNSAKNTTFQFDPVPALWQDALPKWMKPLFKK